MKKFKKVALGLEAGLETQESQGPDICRVFKLDDTQSLGEGEVSGGESSSESSGDEQDGRVRLERG